jgi:hypothetical protein
MWRISGSTAFTSQLATLDAGHTEPFCDWSLEHLQPQPFAPDVIACGLRLRRSNLAYAICKVAPIGFAQARRSHYRVSAPVRRSPA